MNRFSDKLKWSFGLWTADHEKTMDPNGAAINTEAIRSDTDLDFQLRELSLIHYNTLSIIQSCDFRMGKLAKAIKIAKGKVMLGEYEVGKFVGNKELSASARFEDVDQTLKALRCSAQWAERPRCKKGRYVAIQRTGDDVTYDYETLTPRLVAEAIIVGWGTLLDSVNRYPDEKRYGPFWNNIDQVAEAITTAVCGS